jgi:L-seryl-tRNA(Ser) seleniumtransferase
MRGSHDPRVLFGRAQRAPVDALRATWERGRRKRSMSWCCPRSSKPVWGAKASWAGSIPVRFRMSEEPLMTDADGAEGLLRALPAVSVVLARPGVQQAIETHGRATVVRAVRDAIAEARRRTLAGDRHPPAIDDDEVALRAARIARGTLEPVLNGTGVIVHTNLGRAPLAREALEAVTRTAEGYATLEYDLDEGARGERSVHAQDLLLELTGAEDALVVNNNAAAVLLALAANAAGREVVVSRGELVEIGGGFRIPDVLAQSGARLVEVGTTNRTHLRDYEHAIGEQTAIALKVHRSNFAIVGFTADVELAALVTLAHARGLGAFVDAGSGALGDEVSEEPPIRRLVADGADVVLFSGDKLLGGPQAGIAVGRRRFLEPMRRHPLFRALRPDKMCLAALGATLALWRDDPARVPVVRLAAIPERLLESRARRIADAAEVTAIPTEARIGGGAAPLRVIPSWGIAIVARSGEPRAVELSARLRRGSPPIVTRIEDDRVILDLRCIPPEDDARVVSAIDNALDA